MPTPTPCLWFDTQGEDAARFYTSVFPNSRIVDVTRFGEAGPRSRAGPAAKRAQTEWYRSTGLHTLFALNVVGRASERT